VGIPFVKMDGAGNDFVLLAKDSVRGLSLSRATLAALCARRRGIGADGVLIVDRDDGTTIRIEYYNADGGAAALCGNGARCAALFAGGEFPTGTDLTLETAAGSLGARLEREGVSVEMPLPASPPRTMAFDDVVRGLEATFLIVGVPHLIIDVPSVETADVAGLGAVLRRHASLSRDGANIDFVERAGKGSLRLRTYERGVEAETLACGTGAVAAAWWEQDGASEFEVDVSVRGGDCLRVTRAGGRPWLHGPARVVFRGEFSPEKLSATTT